MMRVRAYLRSSRLRKYLNNETSVAAPYLPRVRVCVCAMGMRECAVCVYSFQFQSGSRMAALHTEVSKLNVSAADKVSGFAYSRGTATYAYQYIHMHSVEYVVRIMEKSIHFACVGDARPSTD